MLRYEERIQRIFEKLEQANIKIQKRLIFQREIEELNLEVMALLEDFQNTQQDFPEIPQGYREKENEINDLLARCGKLIEAFNNKEVAKAFNSAEFPNNDNQNPILIELSRQSKYVFEYVCTFLTFEERISLMQACKALYVSVLDSPLEGLNELIILSKKFHGGRLAFNSYSFQQNKNEEKTLHSFFSSLRRPGQNSDNQVSQVERKAAAEGTRNKLVNIRYKIFMPITLIVGFQLAYFFYYAGLFQDRGRNYNEEVVALNNQLKSDAVGSPEVEDVTIKFFVLSLLSYIGIIWVFLVWGAEALTANAAAVELATFGLGSRISANRAGSAIDSYLNNVYEALDSILTRYNDMKNQPTIPGNIEEVVTDDSSPPSTAGKFKIQ